MFEIVLVQIRGRFNIGLGQDRIMFCLSLGWVWNGVFFWFDLSLDQVQNGLI